MITKLAKTNHRRNRQPGGLMVRSVRGFSHTSEVPGKCPKGGSNTLKGARPCPATKTTRNGGFLLFLRRDCVTET